MTRLGLLTVLATAACGEPLQPGLDGPLMFVARLDSTVWQPDSNYRLAILRPPGGTFFIQAAKRIDSLTTDRLLLFGQFRGTGAYILGSEGSGQAAVYFAADGHYYQTTSEAPGRLVVTAIDTIAQVVAGRFTFTGVRPYDAVQLRVTEGRFRLHYVFRNPTPRLPSN